MDHIDTLINNAVGVSPDCDKGFFEANLDYIAKTVDIIAVGTMRVIVVMAVTAIGCFVRDRLELA